MAITLQGFSNTDWARAASTTLAKYMREVEVDVLRNFQMGALPEANGRVTYNNGGRRVTWSVQYKLHRVEGNSGETVRQFNRTNLWKWANLEYGATKSRTRLPPRRCWRIAVPKASSKSGTVSRIA